MDEPLKRLVQLLQQEDFLESQSTAKDDLVVLILRSRKVGRAPLGQPLTGVYHQIYDCLRQQLHVDLIPALQHVNQAELREWASNLLQRATQSILTDDVLKALALEAQSHPSSSTLRRHALVQLVESIRLSGRLSHPHRAKFSSQFYDLLYEDAVNQTLVYVCQRIDTYDPQRGQAQKFMNWVNFRLDRMVIECRRTASDRDTQALPNLNDLEALPQPEPPSSLGEDLQEYIEADAEQIFRSTHIRNHPEANFRTIALARMAGQSWEEISGTLAVKIPTLSSFFQRCCEKFASKFREIL